MLLPRALLLVLASALPPILGQTTPTNRPTNGGPSNSASNSQSQATPSASRTTVTSTSFSLSQSFSGRTAVTVTVPVVVTFVPADDAGPPVPPGNNGEQDNANKTTVDTRTWPTAAKTRDGGPGGGTNGAPSPGQNSNGLYGPPDDYIAAGVRTAALSIGAVLFGVVAVGLI